MIVQESSICRLPNTCGGSVSSPLRARNRTSAYTSREATPTKIKPVIDSTNSERSYSCFEGVECGEKIDPGSSAALLRTLTAASDAASRRRRNGMRESCRVRMPVLAKPYDARHLEGVALLGNGEVARNRAASLAAYHSEPSSSSPVDILAHRAAMHPKTRHVELRPVTAARFGANPPGLDEFPMNVDRVIQVQQQTLAPVQKSQAKKVVVDKGRARVQQRIPDEQW